MKKLSKKMVVILSMTILLCVSFTGIVNAKEIEARRVKRNESNLEKLYYIGIYHASTILLDKQKNLEKDFFDIAKADTIAWIEEFKDMRENEETYNEVIKIYDETYKSCKIDASASNTPKLLETIVYNINKGYPVLIKVSVPKNSARDHKYLIVYGYKESIYETNPMDRLEKTSASTVDYIIKGLSTEEKMNVTFDDLRVFDVFTGEQSTFDHNGVYYFYLSDYIDSYTDICVKEDGSFFVDLYAGNNDECLYMDNDITTEYTEEETKEVEEIDKKEKIEEVEVEEINKIEEITEEKEENKSESFIMKIINKIIIFIKNLIGNMFKI